MTRPIRTTAELEQTVRTPGHKVVYSRSGRKLSPQQLSAAHRRLALREWQEQAQAKINKFEADLVERLNSWREMPTIPLDADYEAALKPRPFAYEAAKPIPPNYSEQRIALERNLHDSVELEIPAPSRVAVGVPSVLGLGAAVAVVLLALQTQTILTLTWIVVASLLFLGGLCASTFVYSTRNRSRRVRVEGEVAKRLEEQWRSTEEQLRRSYESEVSEYDAAKAKAAHGWEERERERIDWAAKLIRGDEATIHEAVCQTLADLDFPFETHTTFAVEDAKTGYLHLDLPEIENVVPGTKYEVLKAGRVKDVKRNETQRQAAYCTVACGVGLMMASAAFAAAPTLRTVSIAAYTQRQQKGSAQIDDDYVYIVSVPREAFAALDVNSINPAVVIAKLSGRVELQANYRFKKLPDQQLPDWIREFRTNAES